MCLRIDQQSDAVYLDLTGRQIDSSEEVSDRAVIRKRMKLKLLEGGDTPMPNLLTTSSTMTCPHGGTVTATSANSRVKVAGDFILRASDTFTIAGCSFAIGPAPHPCTEVRWVQPDAQSQVLGDFTLSDASVGLCVAADQAVQGTVLINFTQQQVSGL